MSTLPRRLPAAFAFLLLALLPAASRAVEEVPFIVTPDNVTAAMLELAGVGPRDHVIDLGSGDGRIVITAARRFGATGLGVEIVPELVAKSNENARRAGVDAKVKFVEQDLFKTDLAAATVVTLYLLPDVNLKLRPALLALKAGTRVVSHDWDMGDWKPDRSIRLKADSKRIGLRKESDIHLWVVPTDVDGVWCGAGNATGTKMLISQQYQRATGTVSNARGVHHFEAAIDATRMQSTKGDGQLTLVDESDVLHVRGAEGVFAHLKDASFSRSCCGSCSY